MCYRRAIVIAVLSLGAGRGWGAVEPENVLVCGPFAVAPAQFTGKEGAKKVEFMPEFDVVSLWPDDGDEVEWLPGAEGRWTETAAGEGGVPLFGGAMAAVTWMAVYVEVDRYTKVDAVVEAPGEIRLYVDGKAAGESGSEEAEASTVSHGFAARTGMHRVLVRVQRGTGEAAALKLRFDAANEEARVSTTVEPRHAPASYDELRAVQSMSGLLLSPDGDLLAVRRSEDDPDGDGRWRRLDVVATGSGRVLAAWLGGSGASAVAWRGDGKALLFRDGNDLFVWSRITGEVERVLRDAPGLSSVAWSRDGSRLVFSSTRGAAEPSKEGARRRVELREKLDDWPTRPHLHLLELAAGVRRRLTVPGDWVQDAFAWIDDGRTLVYLVNRPIGARPWFVTDVHRIDTRSFEDRVVGTLTMGFENRPGLSGFTVSPDGSRAAFVGPPSELGDDVEVEPNAFDPDLFVMDLETGEWFCLTEGLDASVNGNLQWSEDGSAIYFVATEGSRHVLVTATLPVDGAAARFSSTSAGGESIQDLSMNAKGAFAAVASSTDRLPALFVRRPDGTSGGPRLLLDPNRERHERFALSTAEDVAVVGADGSSLDAWLLRPARGDGGTKLPLIVYYYGGATPTLRGYNELHQFLAANGYAVFVVNPRGANGYGRAFADQHVADWGEKAGADILASVESLLAARPDLDGDRVGCYGGSYGGFMTMWLVAHTRRFKAAVSLYGISNLASYWGDGMWGYTYGDQALARKYPWSDPKWFTDHSPLFLADRIETPLLLLHGDEDGNVPPGESEQMFTALRILQRPVEMVRFAGEDHGLRGTWKNRVAHRTMLLDWFDRYLRDRPAAWEARW